MVLYCRTFKRIWRQVADNLDIYKTYPRLIGGKAALHFNVMENKNCSILCMFSVFDYNKLQSAEILVCSLSQLCTSVITLPAHK
jgi:hypothetical protein